MAARPPALGAAELAEILEHRSCAAVVACTPEGIVSFWNHGAEALFRRPRSEAVGRTLAEATSLSETAHRTALRQVQELGCTSFDTNRTEHDNQRVPMTVWFDFVRPTRDLPALVLVTYRDRMRPSRVLRMSNHIPDHSRLTAITPRQRHVLQLIAEGLSTRDIARRIGRSTKTVEAHRANLMKRLGERNLAGLIRLAIDEGLTESGAGQSERSTRRGN